MRSILILKKDFQQANNLLQAFFQRYDPKDQRFHSVCAKFGYAGLCFGKDFSAPCINIVASREWMAVRRDPLAGGEFFRADKIIIREHTSSPDLEADSFPAVHYAAARNLGWWMARGEIIAFTDDCLPIFLRCSLLPF